MIKIDEQEKWSKDVKVKSGKMRELLKVGDDEKIGDKFKSGKALADALVEATGDKSEAASMLAFVANVDPHEDIFDDALTSMGKED